MSDPTTPAALTVLEVAMEMALTPEILDAIAKKFGPEAAQASAMSTSVGGIGPLLRERVIAQADLGINVIGVSLLYDTVWSQGWHDWNHLFLKRVSVGRYLRAVLEDTGILFNLRLCDGTSADVRVRRASYGGGTVYFLDCPEIADVVYPCQEDAPRGTPDPGPWAERQRMRHSWLVGRGALALMARLNIAPDVIVQSETPTIFAQPRLIKDDFQKHPLFARTRCVFNDHTPLEYAHPIWDRSVLLQAKMDPAVYTPFLHNDKIDVTQLLVATSDGVFGVAKKHAVVMRAMPSLNPYAAKIQSITNGVGRVLWQHPDLANAASLSDEKLLALKDRLKDEFFEWLWRRAHLWPLWVRQMHRKPLLLWTRRITSYKRLDILHRIFNNPDYRRRFLEADLVLVVGGRVYQRDNVSEKMVYDLVEYLNHDKEVGERVVFLHNFNVWEAPKQFYGADGSIMLSDDGREASATGFMKAQMNGGAVLANPDGAVPEFMHVAGAAEPSRVNGFSVAYKDGMPDPDSFLNALADFSATHRDPARRAAMIRAALAVTDEVDVARTARETLDFYKRLPVVNHA
jgi:glucan phosphorylase